MIGDGHYLNTILEPGPTPHTTAMRLETTLMRKMMGQPATLSVFINFDKMFSTLPWNAIPIRFDFFTMDFSAYLCVWFSYLVLLVKHSLIWFGTHTRNISVFTFDTQQPEENIFNSSFLSFGWLAEESLYEMSCLSLPTYCPSESWP